MLKTLALSDIVVDITIQPRIELSESQIERYKEEYETAVASKRKSRMPPCKVYFDGKKHILSRGFHRIRAAKSAGLTSLQVDVETGSWRDAFLDARHWSDNGVHGLPWSNADRRKIVNDMLDDPTWGRWSQSQIAEQLGVSRTFVGNIIKERNGKPQDNGKPPTPKKPTKPAEKKAPPKTIVEMGLEAQAQAPADELFFDEIVPSLHSKLKELAATNDEVRKLRTLEEADQKAVVALVGGEVKNVEQAIRAFESQPARRAKVQAEPDGDCQKKLKAQRKVIDNMVRTIDEIVAIHGRPEPDFSQQVLAGLNTARIAISNWARTA